MPQKISIKFAHNFYHAYCIRCNPICRELGMPQTAFDILMFLANNPDYNTAKDIVDLLGLKANLVSVNVERLVRDGYLHRKDFPGDRRKTSLICTRKSQPVIDRGRAVQDNFFEDIFQDVDESSRENFHRVMQAMEHNLHTIMNAEK